MPQTSPPNYEALDDQGFVYMRPAQTIGELPRLLRESALEEATQVIALKLNLKPIGIIQYGVSAYSAFGLDRPAVRKHQHLKLLLTCGDDMPLDYCNSYAPADPRQSCLVLL